jgi:hypothetical protein
MVRATEGLRAEQTQVMVAFALMMATFVASTMLFYWQSMDLTPAVLSTIVTLIAMRYWYYYSMRIIRRFHYDHKDVGEWKQKDSDFDESEPGIFNQIRVVEPQKKANDATHASKQSSSNHTESNHSRNSGGGNDSTHVDAIKSAMNSQNTANETESTITTTNSKDSSQPKGSKSHLFSFGKSKDKHKSDSMG